MQDLSDYRREIDAIDEQLSALFEQRMETVLKVAAYKQAHKMEVLQTGREEEVLKKARARLKDASFTPEIESFFTSMMGISRSLQKRKMPKQTHCAEASGVLGFQGVPGAFSEEALVAFFGEKHPRQNYAAFEDVLKALEAGEIEYGVLPIENSSAGDVTGVYDILLENDVCIVGEEFVKVEHCLLAPRGSSLKDIKVVFSHPQGMMQCAPFLEKLGAEQINVANTAIAAEKVASDQIATHAAVASREAAELYDLDILASDINFDRKNVTRFVILSKKRQYTESAGKISICFSLLHESGSLYNILSHFIYNGLNLTHIESVPLPDRQWEYRFYVDILGNLHDHEVRNALQGVREEVAQFKILGNY